MYGSGASSLRLLLGFRADCGSDVAAHLCECLAMCCRERVEALTLHRLARDGASRADFSARGLAHRPHCLERGGLALDRLEALYVNRNPVVRGKVSQLCRGHLRRAE